MLKQTFKYIVRQLKKTFSKAYVISLIIAFLLWALIKFSALYQERVIFNVELMNLPESYILLGNSSQKVNGFVKTTGFRIFLLKYWESGTVELRFDDLTKINPREFRFNLEDIRSENKPNWMKNATQIQYENSQIVFEVEELLEKKLKVIPKIDLAFKQGYILDYISLSQDSIQVLLPKSQSDVNEIYTYEKQIEDLSKSETFDLSIDLPQSWKIVDQTKKIKCQILVDQLTQGTVSLPIQEHSGIDIKYFPSRVEVKYSIPSKEFNTINEDDIVVKVESPYSEYEQDKALKVSVISKPENVEILSVNPSEVEFLIFDNE